MSIGILIDSSLLINHFRLKDKANTWLAHVLRRESEFFISAVIEYEVEVGMTAFLRERWGSIRQCLTVLPFDSSTVPYACRIKHALKTKNKQIELADLFIAATALAHNLPLATLNRKHFEQIDGLKLLVPDTRSTG